MAFTTTILTGDFRKGSLPFIILLIQLLKNVSSISVAFGRLRNWQVIHCAFVRCKKIELSLGSTKLCFQQAQCTLSIGAASSARFQQTRLPISTSASMGQNMFCVFVLKKKNRGNQGVTSNEQQLVVGVRQIHEEVIYQYIEYI